MIVSHRYGFVFIKTGKTAGSSIEAALAPLCGPHDVVTPMTVPEPDHEPRNCAGRFNPIPELRTRLAVNGGSLRGVGVRTTLRNLRRGQRFVGEHMAAWKVRDRLPRTVWRDYVTFCVERNPWDKVLSGWAWYRHQRGVDLSLDPYLDLIEERIASHPLYWGHGGTPFNLPNYTDPVTGEVIVDRVLRYERLSEELAEVLGPLSVPLNPPLAPRAKASVRDRERDVLTTYQVDRISHIFAEEIALHGYEPPESQLSE